MLLENEITLYKKGEAIFNLKEFKVNLDQTRWSYRGIEGEIHYSDIEHSEGRRLISTTGVALYPDEFYLVLKEIDQKLDEAKDILKNVNKLTVTPGDKMSDGISIQADKEKSKKDGVR